MQWTWTLHPRAVDELNADIDFLKQEHPNLTHDPMEDLLEELSKCSRTGRHPRESRVKDTLRRLTVKDWPPHGGQLAVIFALRDTNRLACLMLIRVETGDRLRDLLSAERLAEAAWRLNHW